MAGPWERYAQPAQSAPAGPWTRFAAPQDGGRAPQHYAFDGSNIPGYDPATGNMRDPYDLTKSLMSGYRMGAEGIAGMAGNVGQMQGGIAKWAAEKLGLSPETAQKASDVASKITPFFGMPTSEDARKEITDPLFGPAHKPESTLGEYVQTGGEFGAGALAPGGPIRKLAMVAVPAITSETAGQATKDTPYEPYARLAGGLVGGGMVAPKLGPSTTRLAARDMGVKSKDMTRIIKQMQRDGLTPADINRRLAELGPDATLMDVGPNLRQEGQRIYAKGGEGRGIIHDVIDPRDKGANARIRGEVDATLGPAPVPSQIDDALAANQRGLEPAYTDVFRGARPVDTTRIAAGLDAAAGTLRGRAQQAVQRVRAMLNQTGNQGTLDTNPGTLHETRKAIDGLMATETDPNAIRALTRARNDIDDALAAAVPDIKGVDARHAELARQREAVTRGQQSLDSGRTAPRPQELAHDVQQGALPQGQQVGPSAVPLRLREGARAEIERIIGTNANDRVALQRLIKGEGDWNRERLATLFGQDRADRLLSVLERESTFANTSNRTIHNSATAERLSESGKPAFGVREGLMSGGAKGAAYSAVVRGIEKAVEKIGLRNADASDANVARMLTTTDRNRIVTALIRANGGRPVPQEQIDAAVRAALLAPGIAASGN